MFLTKEQVEFYKENGYIILDNIFSNKEIGEISDAYDDLFNRKKEIHNLQAGWEGNWLKTSGLQTEKKTVLSIHNLQCHSAVFSKVIMNEKLVDAVSECIGSPNVLLHHTKAHVKPPEKGSAYPPHQDYWYFPYEKDTMIAAFVHVDDTDPENGGLVIFPGSHKNGPLENVSDNPEFFYMDPKKFPFEKGVSVKAKKGDVVLFSYLTVHASHPNSSTRNRRMFLCQFVAAEDRPIKNTHLSLCQGMVLKGKNVNQSADYEVFGKFKDGHTSAFSDPKANGKK